jgi:hypothetical protein
MGWSVTRAVAACTVAVSLLANPVESSDPLAIYATILAEPATRARIDAGTPFVDVLPSHGRDLSIIGAARTRADSDRLVAWVRRIEDFQRGRYVPVAVRFSDPPRIEDLNALVLGATDFDDIRSCRSGNCELKLDAEEIDQLRRTMEAGGANWRSAVQTWIATRRSDQARSSRS